jgi:hypothetical protein
MRSYSKVETVFTFEVLVRTRQNIDTHNPEDHNNNNNNNNNKDNSKTTPIIIIPFLLLTC